MESGCAMGECFRRELFTLGGKRLVFIVCYVQIFIVFTRLACAAQSGDISFPGPCLTVPRLLSLSRSSGSFRHSWLKFPCLACLATLHLPGAEILTIPVRRTTSTNRTKQKQGTRTTSAREELPLDPQSPTAHRNNAE